MKIVSHVWLRSVLVGALLVFAQLFLVDSALAQSTGCCVPPLVSSSFPCQRVPDDTILCLTPNTLFSQSCTSIAQCNNVTVTGCCASDPIRPCQENVTRANCADGTNWYAQQSCSAVSVCASRARGCCVVNAKCSDAIQQSTCSGQFYSGKSCSTVNGCVQPAVATTTTETKKADPITFTPEIKIPGLFDGTWDITGSSIAEYVRVIFIMFIWIVGAVATVMVVYGGIKWVAAAGNPGQINDARDVINSAVIGVIIALSSIVLLNLINPDLITFKSITLGGVKKALVSTFEKEAEPDRAWTPPSGEDYMTIANKLIAHPEWIAAVRANATAQVPAERIYATIFIESAGRETVRSSAGALGLMQLLPSTAADLGYSSEDLLIGTKNIAAGAAYLKSLAVNTCPKETSETRCTKGNPCINGDYRYIHAAYNGGRKANYCSASCPGQTFSECQVNYRYAETRNYILKAQAAYDWIVRSNVFAP